MAIALTNKQQEFLDRICVQPRVPEGYKAKVKYGREPWQQRLARSVEVSHPDACWNFKGSVTINGYGEIYIHPKKIRVHRFVHWVFTGESPEAVCHTCDNRKCVNPAHLFSGTQSENLRDMVKKHRHRPETRPKGVGHGQAILDESQVQAIRGAYVGRGKGRPTMKQIGERFGISTTAVRSIVRGITWGHLD